jgi:hypothetical protein
MTLAASILLGFPLGLWLMFRRRTQVIFGVVWLAILGFQTWDLAFDPGALNRGGETKWYYWAGQPVIFAVGVTLMWVGSRARTRLRRRSAQVDG